MQTYTHHETCSKFQFLSLTICIFKQVFRNIPQKVCYGNMCVVQRKRNLEQDSKYILTEFMHYIIFTQSRDIHTYMTI